MLDATLRDRANGLLTASGRSDVPPVHGDGRDGGGRADRGGRRPCHSHGSRAAGGAGAEDRDRGRARRARRRADRLHLGARHPLAARAHRAALSRRLRLRRRCRADRGHHGLLGRLHPGVSGDVRARRPGGGDGARLSAVPPYPDRARLRAGADRDLERNAPCADRRGLAGGPSQDAAEGRAGRQPGQSDRHDDVARGARPA